MNGMLVLVAIFTLSFAVQCLAEEQEGHEGGFEAEVEVGGLLDADVGDSKGEVGVNKVEASFSYSGFDLEYGLSSYRWDKVDQLPFGNGSDDPWDSLHEISFSADKTWQANEQWSYFVKGGVSSSFEKEMEDSFEYEVTGAAIYALSPVWQFGLGARLSYDAVDEVEIMPVGGIYWNQSAETGWSACLGVPDTNLKYQFSPRFSSELSFSVDEGLYRLADDSTVEKKGYLENSGMALGLSFDVALSENSLFSIGTEYNFAREFTIYDKDGNEKNNYDVDGALGWFVEFAYEF
jgi:hypothetical protein